MLFYFLASLVSRKLLQISYDSTKRPRLVKTKNIVEMISSLDQHSQIMYL